MMSHCGRFESTSRVVVAAEPSLPVESSSKFMLSDCGLTWKEAVP